VAEETSVLIGYAQRGDRATWDEIVRLESPTLRDHLHRRLKQQAHVDAVEKATWARAFEKIDSLVSPEFFRKWICSIANDEELPVLIGYARRGDRAAWDELVRLESPTLRDHLHQRLKQQAHVDAVEKATWARAFEKIDSLDSPEFFRKWIRSIANDEELPVLIGYARRGDRAAWDEIAKRETPRLRGYLRGRLGKEEAGVDDVAQETWIRAFRAIGKLLDPDRFWPWIIGIARNECLTWWRRQKRWGSTLPDDARPQYAPQESDLVELQECLNELPEEQCEVFALKCSEGLSYKQIADSLRVSTDAVTMRLHYAKKNLRKCLERKGIRP